MDIISAEKKYFLELLASILHNRKPKLPPKDIDFNEIYNIAHLHKVDNMINYAIKKLDNSTIDEDILKKFKLSNNKSIKKSITQDIELENILSAFEKNSIRNIPLKGCIIKKLYPSEDMRQMADIDILFEDKCSETTKEIMESLNYETMIFKEYNHDVYYKLPIMNIELHRTLVSEKSDFYDYFNKIWDKAILAPSKKYTYIMNNEDYYIYLLAHLAKHYLYGGTGIRSIMDVWVYLNKYKDYLDWNYTDNELDKLGLLKFSKSMETLVGIWFDGESSNDLYYDITNYIFSCGSYGTAENLIVVNNFMQKPKEKIKSIQLKFIFNRVLPTLQFMQTLYSILKNAPFLLPFFWIIRLLTILFFKRQNLKKEIGIINFVNNDNNINNIRNIYEEVGLK